jgi:hypothetical protein
MRWFRDAAPSPDEVDVARVARELLRLDPWSFWSVELGEASGATFGVVGRTGAFAIGVCPLEGYLVAQGRHLVVDDRRIAGWRELHGAARVLRARLGEVGVPGVEVTPMLVLSRAAAGAPREHRGVRVVRPEDVVGEITKRPHVLDPSTAQRVAAKLGRVLRGPGAAESLDPEP